MIRKYKNDIIIGLAFFILIFAFGIYMNYYLGTAKYWNVLFDLDTPRVVGDIVMGDYNHYRILVHPLLIIIIKPIYLIFYLLVHDVYIALTFMQSLMSAISLVIFYNILKKVIGNKKIIALFTFLFAINFSQIIFTVSIETYIISQFFLILMWYFYIKNKDKDLKLIHYTLWVLLGIGSIAITLTNFFQFIIISFLFIITKKDFLKSIVRFLSVMVLVVVIAEFLSSVQNMLWPTAPNFFTQNLYNFLHGTSEENLYISKEIGISNFINVFNSNFAYLFYVFDLYKAGNGIYVTFKASNISNIFSFVCFGIFIILNIIYIIKNFKNILKDKVYLSLVLVYFFNFCLHLIYGNSICFLYTCHYNFVLLFLIAYILDKLNLFNTKYLHLIIMFVVSIGCIIKLTQFIMLIVPYYSKIDYFRVMPFIIIGISLIALIILLLKNKKLFFIPFIIIIPLCYLGYKLINKQVTDNSRYSEYQLKLNKYENQLKDFKNEYYIRTFSDYREKLNVFFFGMANTSKYVYKEGKLYDIKNNNSIIYEFDYNKEVIIPNEYTVYLENGDKYSIIYENEKGLYINESGNIKELFTRDKEINLPKFDNHRYSEILRVLNQEILFNIDGSEPKPNVFGYKQAYYRDAMIATMVLEYTDNTDIIVPWVNSITKIYDNSRSESINEADNLGELMYILGATKVNNKKLEKQILKEIDDIKNDDNSISGMVDGSIQKYYPTHLALFGASKLGISLNLTVPKADDGYARLTWYNPLIATPTTQDSKYYPYINWAFYHYSPYGLIYILDENYPLSYEGGDVIGDSKVDSECFISDYYCYNQVYISHLWHASEMFLFIKDN